jgi:hypothetical protein
MGRGRGVYCSVFKLHGIPNRASNRQSQTEDPAGAGEILFKADAYNFGLVMVEPPA